MEQTKENGTELVSIEAAITKALELLDYAVDAVKANVQAQGTQIWLSQKIMQAKEKVKFVRDAMAQIGAETTKPAEAASETK